MPSSAKLRRDDRVGVAGEEWLGDLGEAVHGSGTAGDEGEDPDDVETVAWPLLRDGRAGNGGQGRGQGRDVIVLPADEHDAGILAYHAGCQLGFLALGEVRDYRHSKAVGQALDGLVGPVFGGLARAAVGGRE